MTTTPPPPSPRRPLAHGIAGVAWRVAATAAAALVAAEIGLLASVFGAAWAVLLAALVAVVAAATVWRRGALPVAAVACAACLPTAMAQDDPARIAPSLQGIRIVQPLAPDELEASYRQGVGPLLIDLRRADLPPGREITLSARSDTDRVVVALPRDRCVDVTVRYRALPAPGPLTSRALRAASLPWAPPDGSVALMRWFELAPATQVMGPGLAMFGRITPGSPSTTVVTRRTTDPRAVRLTLDVASPAAVVVRDFPAGIGPLGESWEPGTGGSAWPQGINATPAPGAMRLRDAWSAEWTAAERRRGLPQRWDAWLRRVVPELRAQARRAAGTCATPTVRAGYWASVQVPAGDSSRLLSVNGQGTVRWHRWDANGALAPSAPMGPAVTR